MGHWDPLTKQVSMHKEYPPPKSTTTQESAGKFNTTIFLILKANKTNKYMKKELQLHQLFTKNNENFKVVLPKKV